MHSSLTKSFRAEFDRLPTAVQELAVKNYRLWRRDPRHPSLRFKPIGSYWSVRIGLEYRALGRIHEDTIYWFWIGHHTVYDKLIRGR
ncbi:MAG: hypothetical protein JNJ83_10260 [Verrucomicrobiaceae bacterium]|nr:hypothetical protein [Verrucomicrobiaceae bacterium]